MADVVGDVVYSVTAEFDATSFNDNVAQGLGRTRDQMGRFVRENRTVLQQISADMGSIFSAGTDTATSVLRQGMIRAADAAGDGFLERLRAAAGAIPSVMGTALSSGLISVASAASRSAGEAVSEAVAERIRQSVPFWRTAFSESFRASAGPAAEGVVTDVRSGLEGLGDAFTRAGITASAQLGNALGRAAGSLTESFRPAIDGLSQLFQTGMTRAGELGTRALEFTTGRIVPALSSVAENAANRLVSVMSTAGDQAGESLTEGVTDGAETSAEAAGRTWRSRLPTVLRAAVIAAGAVTVAAAVTVGVRAATGLVGAIGSGISGLGSLISRGLSAAGSAVISAAASIGRGAAQAMGDTLRLGVNLAGTAIAGILSASLVSGFGRLSAIDNAEASLRGLEATADRVPEIMEAATNAVTGTAFGLDQAASAAAQFAAANVPIEDMESTLSSLANTAAAAGGDFDGVSSIFAQVAARGNLTGDALARLTDRGVSGLTALADHFGTTTEEVQKMVTEGDVSFSDFAEAMDAAMGSAAAEQATTFTGLISNTRAAMGRFGATMQEPFFEAVKAALPGVMSLFDQFNAAVAPIADMIAERLIPAGERLGEMLGSIEFGGLSSDADSVFGSMAALAPVVGGLAAAFSGPLLSSIPVVGSLFTSLTGPVGILAGALVALFAVNPETLAAGFESIADSLPGILDGIISSATELIPQLAANFASNAPLLIQGFADMFTQLVGAVSEIVPLLIPVAVEAIATLATALIEAAPTLIEAGLSLLGALAEGIVTALPILVEAIPGILESLIGALTEALPLIIESGIAILLALVDGLVTSIPVLITAIVEMIPVLIEALVGALPLIVEGAIALFTGILDGLVTMIPQIVTAIVQMIPLLVTALINAIPQIIGAAVQLFQGIVSGIGNALPNILAAARDLVPEIGSALASAGSQLLSAGADLIGRVADGARNAFSSLVNLGLDAGRSIVNGIADGIRSAVGNVTDAASSVMSSIRDFLPFSPAKVGPFAGSGWSKFSGEAIINDLSAGMNAAEPRATSETSDIMGEISAALRADPGAREGSGSPAAGSTSVVINEYGPRSFGARRREVEWAQRYGTGLRTLEDGALAIQ